MILVAVVAAGVVCYSENEVKNRWYSALTKRPKCDPPKSFQRRNHSPSHSRGPHNPSNSHSNIHSNGLNYGHGQSLRHNPRQEERSLQRCEAKADTSDSLDFSLDPSIDPSMDPSLDASLGHSLDQYFSHSSHPLDGEWMPCDDSDGDSKLFSQSAATNPNPWQLSAARPSSPSPLPSPLPAPSIRPPPPSPISWLDITDEEVQSLLNDLDDVLLGLFVAKTAVAPDDPYVHLAHLFLAHQPHISSSSAAPSLLREPSIDELSVAAFLMQSRHSKGIAVDLSFMDIELIVIVPRGQTLSQTCRVEHWV